MCPDRDQYRRIARRHLDEEGAAIRMHLPPHPPQGWIRSVRDAIGMSQADLGRALDVTGEAVKRYERTEQAGTIQLDTLARAAQAMGCTLRYALVPDESLESFVWERALQLARSELEAVDHTMALEDQLPAPTSDAEIQRRAREILESGRIWRET